MSAEGFIFYCALAVGGVFWWSDYLRVRALRERRELQAKWDKVLEEHQDSRQKSQYEDDFYVPVQPAKTNRRPDN